MNLDRIQTPAVPLRPVGAPRLQQLDVTSAEPAEPVAHAGRSRTQTDAATDTTASIRGVLTADEEHAIADMFTTTGGGYSRAGTATGPPAVPGLRLNLQA